MAILLRVPRLYPEMEEATVGRWIVSDGQSISAGAPVVEIITDKVSYEVEAPADASNLHLLVACAPEKSVVPVESILAVLGMESEANALPNWQAENQALAATRKSELGSAPVPVASATAAPSAPAAPAGVVRATPAARRAARSAGVALEEVALVSAGSTVTEEDVAAFLRRQSGG